MDILKIKNALGAWVEIPAIHGLPGEATPEYIAMYQEVTQVFADFLVMLGIDVATLVGGKVPLSQIPAVAIHEVVQISDESELTSLAVQKYDIACVIAGTGNDKKITVSYQLLADSPFVRSNWVEVGTGYATQAGHATTADNAIDSTKINGHRLVTMTSAQYAAATLEENTLYAVYDEV